MMLYVQIRLEMLYIHKLKKLYMVVALRPGANREIVSCGASAVKNLQRHE
jgi:hypothetical protein